MSNTITTKFSGWKVVAGCFLLMFFGTGVITSTTSLFMAPICQQFGFDTASYSIINLIGSFTNAITAMVIAPRLQKGNMKLILIVSAIVTGLSYAAMGLSTQLWQFIVLGAVYNAAVAGLSGLTASLLLTSWFVDKRSVAVGIAFSGYGLGAAVWAKVFGGIIAGGGWATCYFLGGAITGVVSIIVIMLFLKKSPESCGEQPYTSKAPKTSGEPVKPVEVWQGLTAKQATKTSAFFMLCIAMFFVGCLSAGVATHSINYLIGIGWEMTAASNILALFNIVSIVGMVAGGFMFDKLGALGGTLVVSVCAFLGIGGLLLAQNPMFAYVYAILFPVGMLMPKMLPTLLTSICFGTQGYGSIYSYFNLIFLIGCALGAVITGVINNIAGYGAAWITFMVFCVVIFVFTALAIGASKKLKGLYPNSAA